MHIVCDLLIRIIGIPTYESFSRTPLGILSRFPHVEFDPAKMDTITNTGNHHSSDASESQPATTVHPSDQHPLGDSWVARDDDDGDEIGEDAIEGSTLSTSPQKPIDIYLLPIEVRLMIWELLLPGRRLLKARTRPDPDVPGGILFYIPHKTPILAQICVETRLLLHKHGVLTFSMLGGEPQCWWNPKDDVLFFDHKIRPSVAKWALRWVLGLRNVRNIALDQDHARSLYFAVWTEPDSSMHDPQWEPGDIGRIAYIYLGFWNIREPSARGRWQRHFVPTLFEHILELTIILSRLPKSHERNGTAMDRFCRDRSVALRLHADMDTAVQRLLEYKHLIQRQVLHNESQLCPTAEERFKLYAPVDVYPPRNDYPCSLIWAEGHDSLSIRYAGGSNVTGDEWDCKIPIQTGYRHRNSVHDLLTVWGCTPVIILTWAIST